MQLWVKLSKSLFCDECAPLKTVNRWVQEGRVNLRPENLGNLPYGDILAHPYQRELMTDFKSDVVNVAVKHPPLFCRAGFCLLSHEIEIPVCRFDLQDTLVKTTVLSRDHRITWFGRGLQGWSKSYHKFYT